MFTCFKFYNGLQVNMRRSRKVLTCSRYAAGKEMDQNLNPECLTQCMSFYAECIGSLNSISRHFYPRTPASLFRNNFALHEPKTYRWHTDKLIMEITLVPWGGQARGGGRNPGKPEAPCSSIRGHMQSLIAALKALCSQPLHDGLLATSHKDRNEPGAFFHSTLGRLTDCITRPLLEASKGNEALTFFCADNFTELSETCIIEACVLFLHSEDCLFVVLQNMLRGSHCISQTTV